MHIIRFFDPTKYSLGSKYLVTSISTSGKYKYLKLVQLNCKDQVQVY